MDTTRRKSQRTFSSASNEPLKLRHHKKFNVDTDSLGQITDNNSAFHSIKQHFCKKAFLIAYRLCKPANFHRLCVVKIAKTSTHQKSTSTAEEITVDEKQNEHVTMQLKAYEKKEKLLPLMYSSADWNTLGNSDVLEQLKLLDEKSSVILRHTDGAKKNLSKILEKIQTSNQQSVSLFDSNNTCLVTTRLEHSQTDPLISQKKKRISQISEHSRHNPTYNIVGPCENCCRLHEMFESQLLQLKYRQEEKINEQWTLLEKYILGNTPYVINYRKKQVNELRLCHTRTRESNDSQYLQALTLEINHLKIEFQIQMQHLMQILDAKTTDYNLLLNTIKSTCNVPTLYHDSLTKQQRTTNVYLKETAIQTSPCRASPCCVPQQHDFQREKLITILNQNPFEQYSPYSTTMTESSTSLRVTTSNNSESDSVQAHFLKEPNTPTSKNCTEILNSLVTLRRTVHAAFVHQKIPSGALLKMIHTSGAKSINIKTSK